MPASEDYVSEAEHNIIETLETEYAAVQPEIQSRLAEGWHRASGRNIDPHHITTALRGLFHEGQIISEEAPTRGGHVVTTIHLAGVTLRKTRVAAASRRKRLLMGRYQGWAQGTVRHPHGLIGPAGETAVRTAIVESGALQPIEAGAAEVGTVLGTHLPGPVDSAGFMVPVDHGIPQQAVTVIFEVKNLRSWIYPSSGELYQLLHKGALLATAHPTQQIVPVLVCRRAHATLFWMAHQLGFVVIEMDTQFAGPVDQGPLDEVRNELHFTDLRVGSGPSLRVRDRLAKSNLPRHMPRIADEWTKTTASDDVRATINQIRKAHGNARLRLVDVLRAQNISLGRRGGW